MALSGETESIAKRVDFSEEELALGRALTYVEKYTVVQNFNEFISILREEYGKMIGCHVYIKRDEPNSKPAKKLHRRNHRASSDKHK
jgi:pyruvate formate-lyase activating enzyme-like uncharacterized protein